MTEITSEIRKRIASNLREFGYNVDDEFVSKQVDRIIAGEEPSNIIMMMTKSQLEQNNLI